MNEIVQKQSSASMGRQCIVYMTDQGYLYPTVVSALQARAHTDNTNTDIRIVLHQVSPIAQESFEPICRQADIAMQSIPSEALRHLDGLRNASKQFAARISVTAMARLMIDQILPEHCEDILYLDGDTQILDSLQPLLDYPVTSGKFLASRDYTSIMARFHPLWYADIEAHYNALGLSDQQRNNYFNSGVIRANRETWRKIGRAAIDFFSRQQDGCRTFHDQGALNGAALKDLELISNRWNYPAHFLHLDLAEDQQPAIVHFMANPKPWHGVFPPWTRSAYQPYEDMARRFPKVRPFWPHLSLGRRIGYKFAPFFTQSQGRKQLATKDEIVEALLSPDFAI